VGCDQRIGVYEPVWRIAPEVGAERTSWLRLEERGIPLAGLWHLACAEAEGVPGG
jgi:hypothetical protein